MQRRRRVHWSARQTGGLVVIVTIALFTRDLRIRDNPVLAAAQRAGDAVVPLFVLDEAILSSRFNTPNRAHFMAAALAELDDELRAAGGRLVIRRGTLGDEVERVVADLAVTQVHVAADEHHVLHLVVEDRVQNRVTRLRIGMPAVFAACSSDDATGDTANGGDAATDASTNADGSSQDGATTDGSSGTDSAVDAGPCPGCVVISSGAGWVHCGIQAVKPPCRTAPHAGQMWDVGR